MDLGCSTEMIDHNLDIIQKMEQARKDFFFRDIANKEKKRGKYKMGSPGPIDTGDVALNELYSDDEHANTELEKDHFGQ